MRARLPEYKYILDEKEKETEKWAEEIKIFLATFLQNTFASCKTLYE